RSHALPTRPSSDLDGAGTRDRIRIGTGIVTDVPVTDVAGSPVDIVGDGSTSTVLRTSGTNATILKVAEPTSTVSHLQIQITGSGNETALQLAGSANHIQVTSSGVQNSTTGIEFSGTDGLLSNSVVNLGYSA